MDIPRLGYAVTLFDVRFISAFSFFLFLSACWAVLSFFSLFEFMLYEFMIHGTVYGIWDMEIMGVLLLFGTVFDFDFGCGSIPFMEISLVILYAHG